MSPTLPTPKPILTPTFLDNPYPTYHRFLDEGPTHRVAMGPNFQAASSYAKRTGARLRLARRTER